MTKVLGARLMFAFHVLTAKKDLWIGFLAIKKCSVSRFKVRNRFLYPPASAT